MASQHSDQLLQAMFDQAAVGVALVDMETGRFERVNQRYAQILGYRIDELKGRHVSSLSDPDDAAYQLNQALRDELRQGDRTAFHVEKRQRRKDGNDVWIDLTVAPVVQADGRRRYNMGIIQDVTERRAMQEALRSSEARLRGILDHLPVGILLSGPDRRLMFHNRNFVEITGYNEQDFSDEGAWWLHAFPDPDNRRKAMTRWQELRAQAPRHNGLIERDEYDICRADGTFITVGISGIVTDDGEIAIVEDLSRYKAAQEQINYLAYYDSLTGLANRHLLMTRLIEAQRQSARSRQYGAVLMLGLDRFKILNEARGHSCGDQLLRQVAQRLQASLRPTDTPSRYGGDTFVLVLDASCSTRPEAATHADQRGWQLLRTLRDTPFMLDGEAYRAGASIGAVVFQGQGEAPESLLRQVEIAMYQAKVNGRNTLVFYDIGLDKQVRMRAQLETELQVAIEQRQLVPYFQAQVSHGQIVGAEVLVRWNHPHRGLISPTDFISVAEETGMILPLGAQMLQAACRQLAHWKQVPLMSHLALSVNISPLQFYQDDFVAQVLALMADSNVNPHLLGLEVTESVLLQNMESTVTKMQQLKMHGIRFALDDFGTGYSSLAYLKRLPLDQLKIDRSFVRDVPGNPGNTALVRTIVSLGEAFGLQVVAEGVETSTQRDFLSAQGCSNWQGHLFSKPLPLNQFEALVANRPAAWGMNPQADGNDPIEVRDQGSNP